MSTPTVLTIVTNDYLPRAIALHRSLRDAYGEQLKFAALAVDGAGIDVTEAELGFKLVRFDELKIPSLWDMAFRYDKGALANALKPFFIQQMMRQESASSVIFLDADTLAYKPFHEVHALLDSGTASIILTPHFDRPQARKREPQEIDLLRHGVMNGGFVALANDERAHAFLSWWSDHLLTECIYDPDKGYYGDQHWLDLVPALFDKVHILRNRTYNAAYWNFPDRSPRRAGGRWLIDGEPLTFFHFSQWRLEQGETVGDRMQKLFCSDDPDLATLLTDYRDRWIEACQALPPERRGSPSPFAVFSDGAPIPRGVREAYADTNPGGAWPRDRVFDEGRALMSRPASDVPSFKGIAMPELYVQIWRRRADLRHFDLSTRKGQLDFTRWVLQHGAVDYDLSPEALAPARQSVQREAELARTVAGIQQEAVATHAKIRSNDASIADLVPRAGAVLQEAAAEMGLESLLKDRDISDSASFFRAISDLGKATATRGFRQPPDGYFADIEAHGKYLARELNLDYEVFLEAGAAPRDTPPGLLGCSRDEYTTMLEADALLNACSAMTRMFEGAG